ncbi:hypothetical protein TNCV_2730221 [Trichonephila clavipes]|nr:hypothetical protein TNCV_2730221 [Trichonephila clavipes]
MFYRAEYSLKLFLRYCMMPEKASISSITFSFIAWVRLSDSRLQTVPQVFNRIQEKNSIKKAGKGRKRYTKSKSVDDRRIKILRFRDKRTSWTSIRSDISDGGVSVSSQTTRSRLADARNSPDLDPVENLRCRLKTLVRMRRESPITWGIVTPVEAPELRDPASFIRLYGDIYSPE